MNETTPAPGALPPGSASFTRVGGRVRVTLRGEFDAATKVHLSQVTDQARAEGLPIDLDVRDVTFMDSATVAVLARLALSSTHRLRILHPPEAVRFLLEVTDLVREVDIVDGDVAGQGIRDGDVTGPDVLADDVAGDAVLADPMVPDPT